jgi:hypothetical protein
MGPRDIRRRIDQRPVLVVPGSSTPPLLPWLALQVKAGNTLLSTPAPVYGIKRKAGEAKATAWIHTPRTAAATCGLGSGGAAGQVTTVTVSDRGSCYNSAPSVSVSAPPSGGTQAVITANVSDGGQVEGVYITNCGSGYADGSNYAVTFSDPGGGGVAAAGTASVRDGKIVKVILTGRGRGYSGTATVTIAGPGGGGTTATATCEMCKGGISLTITTAGAGYVTAPTVTIAAPSALPVPNPASGDPSTGTDYADGIGYGTVGAGSLTGGYTVGIAQLIVNDDRSLIAWGLVGLGASVPNSRSADTILSWYLTEIRLTIADANADGVLPAWVPMGVG